jgi:hypothetical protein
MFIRTIYKSTVTVLDLGNQIRKKRTLLGYGLFLMDCPVHFFFN